MKTSALTTLFVLTLSFCLSSFASAQDLTIEQSFDLINQAGSEQDVQEFPAKLHCTDIVVHKANTLNPVFQHAYPEFASEASTVRVDAERTQILLDNSDGDQVQALLIQKADIEALISGEQEVISVKNVTGFWWSDGIHLEVETISCSL